MLAETAGGDRRLQSGDAIFRGRRDYNSIAEPLLILAFKRLLSYRGGQHLDEFLSLVGAVRLLIRSVLAGWAQKHLPNVTSSEAVSTEYCAILAVGWLAARWLVCRWR